MTLGSLGYVGYAKESEEGNLVAPSIFLPVSSFDFEDTNDYIIPDQLRGHRSRSVAMASPYAVSGSMDLELVPNGIASLLKSAFAAEVTSGAYTGGGYEHVFEPGNASDTFTFEASAADVLIRRWGGVRVNTFEMNAAFGEIVTASFGLEGTTRGTTPTPAEEDYADVEPFHFTGASVKVAGVQLATVKDFTFGTSNNIDRIGTLNKTRNWRRTALGMFDVNLSATLDFEDDAEYERFLAEDEFEVQLHLEGGIVAGTKRNTLHITLPRVRWQGIGLPLGATDFLEQSVTALVLKPAGAPIFEARLVNSEASVA